MAPCWLGAGIFMLAVFDVEGTVAEGEFWDQFTETRGTAAAAMNGEIGFRQVMEQRFNKIRGMKAVDFMERAEAVRPRPGAKKFFAMLRENGFETACVSGAFDFLVERIAREVGAGKWVANRPRVEKGRVTGFEEPLVDAQGKREFVEGLQQSMGFTKAETIVVGDGANDLEMMKAAGLGVAFNAKPVVAQEADVAVDGNSLEALAETIARYQAGMRQRHRVLVAGKLEKKGFEDAGINAAFYDSLDRKGLLEKIRDFHVLVYRGSEKIDAEVMDAAKKLRLIVRPGVGLDHIDLAAAEARGIRVVNTPTASTETVAEHAICLMLSLLRKIPQAHASTKAGKWEKNAFHGTQLAGKTVGIAGVGRIGRAVARRLKAFGVRLVGYDPYLHPEDFADVGVERMPSFAALLAQADVVTLHVPLTQETKNMLNAKTMASMKKGAYLVNVSRGKVVEEKALCDALEAGRLAGAALDVFPTEPLEKCALHGFDNVILTPHIAGSTAEAVRKISEETAARILEFEAGFKAGSETEAGAGAAP
ncbi:MAG: HAD-IB family phosphatase [Candidatus Micrarchaeota archaeon]|nr:HAD-IB family phosphatase [Candidatus Micrarchaeota archaeon]